MLCTQPILSSVPTIHNCAKFFFHHNIYMLCTQPILSSVPTIHMQIAISKSDNESVESELLLSAVSDPLRFQKTGCSKLSHEVQKFTDKVYDSKLDMLQIFHQSASKKCFTCVPNNQKLQCPVPKPNQNIVKSVVVINIFQTLFYTGKTVQKNG